MRIASSIKLAPQTDPVGTGSRTTGLILMTSNDCHDLITTYLHSCGPPHLHPSPKPTLSLTASLRAIHLGNIKVSSVECHIEHLLPYTAHVLWSYYSLYVCHSSSAMWIAWLDFYVRLNARHGLPKLFYFRVDATPASTEGPRVLSKWDSKTMHLVCVSYKTKVPS